jgi:ornithine carbamoyltransferase
MPVLTGSSRQLVHPSDSGMVEARDRWNAVERAPERPAEERAFAQVGPGEWRTRKQSLRDAQPLWLCKKGGTAGHDAARPFRSHYAGNARLGVFESRKGATLADSTVPVQLHESLQARAAENLRAQAKNLQVVDRLSDLQTKSLGGGTPEKLRTFTVSTRLRGRSLVEDTDLTTDEILDLLDTAARLKRMHRQGEAHTYLPGKTLGMVFQHPSTRTRVSFEAGMAQLGGTAIYLGVNDLQLRRGETVSDTAKVLGRYVDVLVARVKLHSDIQELAANAGIPVINGLSDGFHPTQALADLLTLQENFGRLHGLKVAYVGDGNNVAVSLMLAAASVGVSIRMANPVGYEPPADIVTQATWLAAASDATLEVYRDPREAVRGADAIYTDVHVSMGMEETAARAVALAPYKVTTELMSLAAPHAIFMHDLPMHRDEEVEAAVADGPQSVIFDQAENRLHAHKALLLQMLC